MTPNEAFDYVLNEYQVSADEIARISGLHKSAISKFRNGKHQMNSDNLQKLVQALPPEARSHFTMLFSFSSTKVAEKDNTSKV
jgi:transcriptional regulator with XRE-family HTH domain